MIFVITYWTSAFILRPILGMKLDTFWFIFHAATCAGCYALLKGYAIIQ